MKEIFRNEVYGGGIEFLGLFGRKCGGIKFALINDGEDKWAGALFECEGASGVHVYNVIDDRVDFQSFGFLLGVNMLSLLHNSKAYIKYGGKRFKRYLQFMKYGIGKDDYGNILFFSKIDVSNGDEVAYIINSDYMDDNIIDEIKTKIDRNFNVDDDICFALYGNDRWMSTCIISDSFAMDMINGIVRFDWADYVTIFTSKDDSGILVSNGNFAFVKRSRYIENKLSDFTDVECKNCNVVGKYKTLTYDYDDIYLLLNHLNHFYSDYEKRKLLKKHTVYIDWDGNLCFYMSHSMANYPDGLDEFTLIKVYPTDIDNLSRKVITSYSRGA